MDIILVHFGGNLPEFVADCITQIKSRTDDRVLIYAPNHQGGIPRSWARQDIFLIKKVEVTENWREFREHQFLYKYGLGGFWQYACERFFAIESLMKSMGVSKAMHLENDNLIYFKPDWEWLDERYNSLMALTRINEQLLSGGVVYIGSPEALEAMNEIIVFTIKSGAEKINETYGNVMANEMFLLHIAAETCPEGIRLLPSTPENAEGCTSKFVYDCASWGQFVGGTFQNPDVPFAHDSHIIGRGIINKAYDCHWMMSGGIKYPVAVSNVSKLEKPLFNLHIHSKNLMKWRT